MIFVLPLIGAAVSALGAGVLTAAAAASASTGLGSILGGLGASAGLGLAVKGAVGVVARKTALGVATNAIAGAALCGVTKEVGESFVKKVFCDTVKPKRGSILKIDLACGSATHSGVYVGHDRIVEVTEDEGEAIVREVSPSEFLHGDGLVRTGAYIYVASSNEDGKWRALSSETIARRAEAALGHRGKYSLAFNNCHMFTRYCITGEDQDFPTWSINRIAGALRDKFGVSHVSWRSTGDFA
ncbi:MAG: lecithin retinol acyltransferase family protein [Kiritimatiellae bacterium]|nr:lecithin retinol acyltransferase family protein [Kiritimatiellia bacterium]MBQ3345202.1 lecithin retinol acyltransferase family protein [Kiritimatiellia bacterium]